MKLNRWILGAAAAAVALIIGCANPVNVEPEPVPDPAPVAISFDMYPTGQIEVLRPHTITFDIDIEFDRDVTDAEAAEAITWNIYPDERGITRTNLGTEDDPVWTNTFVIDGNAQLGRRTISATVPGLGPESTRTLEINVLPQVARRVYVTPPDPAILGRDGTVAFDWSVEPYGAVQTVTWTHEILYGSTEFDGTWAANVLTPARNTTSGARIRVSATSVVDGELWGEAVVTVNPATGVAVGRNHARVGQGGTVNFTANVLPDSGATMARGAVDWVRTAGEGNLAYGLFTAPNNWAGTTTWRADPVGHPAGTITNTGNQSVEVVAINRVDVTRPGATVGQGGTMSGFSASVRAGYGVTGGEPAAGPSQTVTWSVPNADHAARLVGGNVDIYQGVPRIRVLPNATAGTVRVVATAVNGTTGYTDITVLPVRAVTLATPLPATMGRGSDIIVSRGFVYVGTVADANVAATADFEALQDVVWSLRPVEVGGVQDGSSFSNVSIVEQTGGYAVIRAAPNASGRFAVRATTVAGDRIVEHTVNVVSVTASPPEAITGGQYWITVGGATNDSSVRVPISFDVIGGTGALPSVNLNAAATLAVGVAPGTLPTGVTVSGGVNATVNSSGIGSGYITLRGLNVNRNVIRGNGDTDRRRIDVELRRDGLELTTHFYLDLRVAGAIVIVPPGISLVGSPQPVVLPSGATLLVGNPTSLADLIGDGHFGATGVADFGTLGASVVVTNLNVDNASGMRILPTGLASLEVGDVIRGTGRTSFATNFGSSRLELAHIGAGGGDNFAGDLDGPGEVAVESLFGQRFAIPAGNFDFEWELRQQDIDNGLRIAPNTWAGGAAARPDDFSFSIDNFIVFRPPAGFEPELFTLTSATTALPSGWVAGADTVNIDVTSGTIVVSNRSDSWHGLDIPVGFFTGGGSYTITVSGTIDDGGAGDVQLQIGRNPWNGTLGQAFSGAGSTFTNTTLTFTAVELAAAIAATPSQTHVRLNLQSDPNTVGANTFDFTITALTITRAP